MLEEYEKKKPFRLGFCWMWFLDLSKRIIKFTSNGDGIGTYDIFQYQIIDSSETLDYRIIGEFSDADQHQERWANFSE